MRWKIQLRLSALEVGPSCGHNDTWTLGKRAANSRAPASVGASLGYTPRKKSTWSYRHTARLCSIILRITWYSRHKGTKMAIRFRGAWLNSSVVGIWIRRRPKQRVTNHRYRQARSRKQSSRLLTKTQLANSSSI